MRKKRWNYWAVVSPTHLFSVTLSNVDYLGLPFIYLLDFERKVFAEKTLIKPFGAKCRLLPKVDDNMIYDDPDMPIQMLKIDAGIHLLVECPDFEGKPLKVDLTIHKPQGHEP